MNLILFGFKKCGKTYYGLKVASRMRMRFVETDILIEELYFARYHEQLACRDIVINRGQDFFRELEEQVIYSFAQVDNTVISLGGGAVLNPRNADHLKKMGTLVYLKMNKDALKHRILTAGELPSYFDKDNPAASFEKMYAERKPVYEQIPAFTIDMENKTEEQIVELLCELIANVRASGGQ